MKYYEKIPGKRIYLSPMNPDDVDKYTKWINDLEISLYLNFGNQVFSREKEKEALEELSRQGHNFAIVEREYDNLIGNCSLMDVDQTHSSAELGIFIGNKDYWNKGYGHEAVTLLLDYGFSLLNLENIMLRVHSFNKRAINCYKKCGFKEMGRRRNSYLIDGEKYDDIFMDIVAEEFTGDIADIIE